MDKEYLKNDSLQKCTVTNSEELLSELSYMQSLVSGRIDVWFSNNFLSEAVQLLINSIFLMEDGYFDCAFYSIRQSAETMNNMLLLCADKSKLEQWKCKGFYPVDAKVKEQLKTLDCTYKEFRSKLTVFFDEFDGLIKSCHKIIHKQGFDSFYKQRYFNSNELGFDKNKELLLFDKLLKYSICRLYLFFIILDPVGLILADPELDKKFNFAPMTEAINLGFIEDNYSVDLIALIKETNFYMDLKTSFSCKETMNDYVYSVVREQYFNIDHLSEIAAQKHLLNYSEQFMLFVLQMGLKISEFHIGGISILPYWTSIESNYQRHEWSSNEYDAYKSNDFKANLPYNNVFLTCVPMYDDFLFLQHNKQLSDEELHNLNALANQLNQQYQTIMETITEFN